MPSDDISDIHRHYELSPSLEADRLSRHPIEFEVTMRHLRQHLPESGSILDVGCATGAYSISLAKSGYDVTAVDISPALVQLCGRNAAREGVSDHIQTFVADARDLSQIPGTEFDAVMLMGPLYHLIVREDRQKAIAEAVGRMKPSAPFFSAHINRIGMLAHIAKTVPEWIEQTNSVESVLSRGHDDGTHPRDGRFRGYFATVEELAPLHEEMGLQTVAIAAADPASVAIDESFRALPANQQELWLDLFFRVSAETSFRGGWPHLLYIGRCL